MMLFFVSFGPLFLLLALLLPAKLGLSTNAGNIRLDLRTQLQITAEGPQGLVDCFDFIGYGLSPSLPGIQRLAPQGQCVDFSLYSIHKHGKLALCVDAVGLQKPELPLVAVQLCDLLADRKGNSLLLFRWPPYAKEIHVIEIQRTKALCFPALLAVDISPGNPIAAGLSGPCSWSAYESGFWLPASAPSGQALFDFRFGIALAQAAKPDEP